MIVPAVRLWMSLYIKYPTNVFSFIWVQSVQFWRFVLKCRGRLQHANAKYKRWHFHQSYWTKRPWLAEAGTMHVAATKGEGKQYWLHLIPCNCNKIHRFESKAWNKQLSLCTRSCLKWRCFFKNPLLCFWACHDMWLYPENLEQRTTCNIPKYDKRYTMYTATVIFTGAEAHAHLWSGRSCILACLCYQVTSSQHIAESTWRSFNCQASSVLRTPTIPLDWRSARTCRWHAPQIHSKAWVRNMLVAFGLAAPCDVLHFLSIFLLLFDMFLPHLSIPSPITCFSALSGDISPSSLIHVAPCF